LVRSIVQRDDEEGHREFAAAPIRVRHGASDAPRREDRGVAAQPDAAREDRCALTATTVFDRVVCAVDRSRSGIEAVRVAARVTPPQADLVVVRLEEAPGSPGRRVDAALRELEGSDATLAVTTMRARNRAVGIAAGSVATHLLHEAPCSVLVVPERDLPDGWPSTIAVGVDGSAESAAAAAAWELARRVGARVRAVAATGRPGHADLGLVRRIAPDFEERPIRPVTALAEVSEEVDLLVVGSRGLRGVRALGSVSERVAHEARCPVLIVRPESAG
jgi:nucleotide-binding universal stress UspA family protein